jgi:hypothetical protein
MQRGIAFVSAFAQLVLIVPSRACRTDQREPKFGARVFAGSTQRKKKLKQPPRRKSKKFCKPLGAGTEFDEPEVKVKKEQNVTKKVKVKKEAKKEPNDVLNSPPPPTTHFPHPPPTPPHPYHFKQDH